MRLLQGWAESRTFPAAKVSLRKLGEQGGGTSGGRVSSPPLSAVLSFGDE